MKSVCLLLLAAVVLIPVCQANIRIVGSYLSPPMRVVFYEKCGASIGAPVTVTPAGSPSLTSFLASSSCSSIPSLPAWMVTSCGGAIGPSPCSYAMCLVNEPGGWWSFSVIAATPTTCNVNGDYTRFSSGVYTPEGCC